MQVLVREDSRKFLGEDLKELIGGVVNGVDRTVIASGLATFVALGQ